MVAAQFVGLGLISVALNTAADVVVTFLAARLRRAVAGNPRLIGRLRQGSGAMMVALGASLLLVRRPV
jgi:threonine/homoserine/homoserine lactone efflux protein